ACRDADARRARADVRRRRHRAPRRGRPCRRASRAPPRPRRRRPRLTHALLHPWGLGFMQRALLELVLVGLVGGVLGCWIVLYELSYSAESLAHALFPGLVLAALLGVPLVLGGALGVLVAAAAVELASRAPGTERDTAVAIVITSLFGLGVLVALSPASPPG